MYSIILKYYNNILYYYNINRMNNDYKHKYLKYKKKYIYLNKKFGGDSRKYTQQEIDDYKSKLPYQRDISYQRYNFVLKIVRPNKMMDKINDLKYSHFSSSSDLNTMIKSAKKTLSHGLIDLQQMGWQQHY